MRRDKNLDQSGMRPLPIRPGTIPPSAMLTIFRRESSVHGPRKVCQARPQDCMALRILLENMDTLWYTPKEARR